MFHLLRKLISTAKKMLAKRPRRPVSHRVRLELESLEDRIVPSSITWTNREDPSNNFALFGSNAEAARQVVDAALSSWARVITNFNRPDGTNELKLTISMANSGVGWGAGANITAIKDGFPTEGVITIYRGADTNNDNSGPPDSDGNPTDLGDGAGWFLDQSPLDWSEFSSVTNAFSGSSNLGQVDLYSMVLHELTHVLGISQESNLRLHSPPAGANLLYANTNVPDTEGGFGTFWLFQGPSVTHLLTSNNNGTENAGVPVHTAPPGYSASYNGVTYYGERDVLNAGTRGLKRDLVPSSIALMLKDAYGYSIVDPKTFGTFLAVLNPVTNVLTITGDPQLAGSNISLDVVGSDFSVDVSGVKSSFPTASVSSIVINAGAGNDYIRIERTQSGIPVTVNAGAGYDAIHISQNNRFLDNIQGNITISGDVADDLHVHDDTDPYHDVYTLTGTTLTRNSSAAIIFAGVSSVRLDVGQVDNSINVEGVASGTTVRIYGSSNTSTFNVGPAARNLNALQGNLYLHGAGGADTLNVNDQANSLNATYTITNSTVKRNNSGQISFDGIAGVSVNGGSSNDTYNVVSTGVPLTIKAGGDATNFTLAPDTVRIGSGGSLQSIQGDVTITNPPHSTAVYLDDYADTAHPTVTLDTVWINGSEYGQVGGLSVGKIKYKYADTSSLTVSTGTGGAAINVRATGASTCLNGNGPNTIVNLGRDSKVDGILGSVSITNPLYYTTVVVDDSADPIGRTATIDVNGGWDTISGLAPATIRYGSNSVSSVNVKGGLGSDNFIVSSTTGFPLTLNGGNGGDTLIGSDGGNNWVVFGNNAGYLNGTHSFSSFENLTGGLNTDQFSFINGSGVFGAVDGGSGANTLDFSSYATGVTMQLSPLSFTAGSATPIQGGFTNIGTAIGSGAATDFLAGPWGGGLWQITDRNRGCVGTFSFNGIENLTGNLGADTFRFGPQGSIDGRLADAASQPNGWLDYSSRGSGVTVDLANSTATGVNGGILNIQNVLGSVYADSLSGNSQGNVLVGGGGNDTISGRGGRSVLIGGGGSDTMMGGNLGDLIISGVTDFDSDQTALSSILSEWQRVPWNYADRVAALRAGSGFLNGRKLDWGTTVRIDTSVDVLTGGADQDWFFANLGTCGAIDSITDRNAGGTEVVNNNEGVALSIGDVSLTEGDSGTKALTFTVSLSTASALPVTVHYATADGTDKPAGSGADYQSTSGDLSFAAGETSKTVSILVNGDTAIEQPYETFFVKLSNATNAVIADSQAVGTIIDDDAPLGSNSTSLGGKGKAPVVGVNTNGISQLFAIGTDNNIWTKTQISVVGNIWPTNWTGWRDIGDIRVKSLAVQRNTDGRLQLFAIDLNNVVMTRSQTVAGGVNWTAWSMLGGASVASLSVVANSDGRLAVFAIDSNNAVVTWTQTVAGGGNWVNTNLGGYVKMLTVAANSDGRVQIFAIGSDDKVWTRTQSAAGDYNWTNWAGWTTLNDIKVKSLTVQRNTNGRLQLFAIDLNNAVWTRTQTAAGSINWDSWISLGGICANATSLTVGVNADGRLQVFGIGQDGRTWTRTQTSAGATTWSPSPNWTRMGGYVKELTLSKLPDGRLQLFAIGNDDAVWVLPPA